MSVHNEEIAAAFEEMADLLAIQGGNPFRIRAYQLAAQVVRGLPRELSAMQGAEEYDKLPGIGADLAGKIAELVRTGELRALTQLRRQVPAGLRELLELPGLGPVRVRALRSGLRIRNRADLKRALAAGRLARLRGFGPAIEARLKTALAGASERAPKRPLRTVAAQFAEPLRAYLKSVPGVSSVEIAGSYRRGRDTVGDLDVLVGARTAAATLKALRTYPDLRTLTAAGTTKATGVLRNGMQVDIRVVAPQSFGAALHYFTGSRDHNIHIRRRAQERGCKLSEYGLFRGGKRVAGASEEELFEALGLEWIAPELREDRGEIEAAEAGALPELIARADLQGDLHVHTDASDGRETLAGMVEAARRHRLRYVAITDHAQHLGIVHGLDAERLARQADAIDALNEKLEGLVVLKGAEVDILEDGRLALPDAALARLDVVVIAIHGHFDKSEAEQTSRVLRALERPHVNILAHPSGRLLGERAPCALDFGRIIAAARARGCCLEVNGQPNRLDLDDVHVKAARDAGVLLSLASDAHAAEQFACLEGAVLQARRGWARRQDVLNTRPLAELRKLLKAARR
ncbi:MAG TPA: DNA polymerase/3'-5' exonuclease PolX [Steroidobacteraceae bacterium]|nr:DNA polymerase/3'-5' exonuclease PolX [Steroidobacteraceae bacterium]